MATPHTQQEEAEALPPPMRTDATADSVPAPVFPVPAKQIAQAAATASTSSANAAEAAAASVGSLKHSALAPPVTAVAPTSTSTLSSRSPSPQQEQQPPPPSLDDTLLPDGSLDMRALMIALWRNRKNAAFTAELCARLPRLSISPATLDQVEFYLPQLAHMVVHLEKELPMEAMEQFVLLLSQTSVHFALQFFWIIFAAFDENRPKRGGNPRTFARCAQLLLALEQCFVYGSPAAREASELLTRNSISRDEMDQIVMADRRFFAAQSSLEICYEGACISPSSGGGADKGAGGASSSGGGALSPSGGGATAAGGGAGSGGVGDGGWLFKKGGGTSKMGRRNWTLRWCRVENRILLVFTRPSDANPRTAFPLVRAEIRVLENKKHPFYFELVHELSETRMQFAAQSQEELVAWIAVLQKHAAAPEPPATGGSSSPGKVSTGRTLARMSFAMRSFILASSSGTPVVTAAASSPTTASAPVTEVQDDSEASSSSPARTESSGARTASSSLVTSGTRSPASRERAQLFAHARSMTETGEVSSSTSQSECFQLQALATSALPPEQQLRYEFFTGMINFVKAITDVSESLRRIEPPKRKPLLRPRLEALRIPPLAYIPLCKSTDTYCNVTSVLTSEGRVFSTNERAPCMIYFETEEDANGDDVSKALFTQLYAGTNDVDSETGGDANDSDAEGDDVEEITTIDSSDEILKYLEDSPPKLKAVHSPKLVTSPNTSEEEATAPRAGQQPSAFLHQLLASPARKQKLERIFGELTVSAVKRLRSQAGDADRSRWRLCCLMAKSYDDLRQEVLVMQLISYFQHIFKTENLSLWLQPYRILSTGASTGLLEVVRNTTSLDGIKKTPGFKNLRTHFQDVYGSGSGGDKDDDDGDELLKQAELNFIHSLAGYSLVCYTLAIKDRHNGNILLDVEGHIVHIDFGFFLGRAPGGSFSFETAPFKLTTEMVDVLGGRHSSNFQYFSDLCVQGALAIRKHAETIYTLVEVMSLHSRLPCFLNSVATPLAGLRERLFLNVAEEKVAPLIRSMIDRSYDHFGTNKYDQFQVYSNGIAK